MTLPSWDLMIPTYQREEILPRCLGLAAAQSVPPASVVVVDASPGWEKTRDLVMREIAAEHPRIRWVYEKAVTASSASQRNQGLKHCTAEIVFFIDDDTLMYPDAAERVLAVYARDAEKKIAGINMLLVATPPEDAAEGGAPTTQWQADRGGWLKERVRNFLRTEEMFIPYDGSYPVHELPASVAGLNVGLRKTLISNSATMRRELAERELFDEMLVRYAYYEDVDQSYRLSRHGAILSCYDARVHHVGSPGGRLRSRIVSAFGALNVAVLARVHAKDLARARRETSSMLRRRMVIDGVRDLSRREWGMPRLRGVLDAARAVPGVYRMSPGEVRAWYPGFQRELIAKYGGK